MAKKRGRKRVVRKVKRRSRKVKRKSRKPKKDPIVALLLELVPGFVGVLGIGHFYLGDWKKGLMFMIGYWIYLFFGITTIYLTFPFGALLIVPIALSIYFWALVDAYHEAQHMR